MTADLNNPVSEAVKSYMARTASLASDNARVIRENHAGQATRRAEAMSAHLSNGTLANMTFEALKAYTTDVWQRSLLTMDVMRERGNLFNETEASGQPPVLDFAYEIIVDGSLLSRPVNYQLLKITPPEGRVIDFAKRPFMIVDPRAGHGAGIGGFKPESQVGEAFEDGHAVYFVVFKPHPEPGQTLADVRDAEVTFLDEIRRRHPDAEKPVVIGNCQGGWASMLLGAAAPDKIGPISINGAPMSYWAGEAGKNPMRYMGGMMGGVVPALMLSDLGNGVFDGSLLVQNFENMNPANTNWKKMYNLYSNVDSEAGRFLEFERWWGGFFMMNKEEISWIVDNLFVGNRLGVGQATLGGEMVDLKKIKSPIVVFASHGDNITPPQQALNWIADLYRDVNEIKAYGQRIVYMVHDSIGHLGIFVSAKIAGREHDAITDTMRAIEALPPGLYEMVLEQGDDRMHIKFAPRTIEDILALDDGRADEEMFAAVAKLSETGADLYEKFMRPVVRSMVTEDSAKLFFQSSQMRVERAALSDKNPLMAQVKTLAAEARADRQPVARDNPFLAMEKLMSDQIEQNWNLFRDVRDSMQEIMFHTIYGSPMMRMMGAGSIADRQKAEAENLRELPHVKEALAHINEGGEAEGSVRMLELLSHARGYVRRSRLERELEMFRTQAPFNTMTDEARARMIHNQAIVVQFEPEQAKSSLPLLLDTPLERQRALAFVMQIAGPEESMHPDALILYREFEAMLDDAGETQHSQLPNGAAHAAVAAGINTAHAVNAAIDEGDFDDDSVEPMAPVRHVKPSDGGDNLLLIKGIGPKINKKLNEMGIHTFAQIESWTAAEVAWVNREIDVKGRIQREKWIDQARLFLNGE